MPQNNRLLILIDASEPWLTKPRGPGGGAPAGAWASGRSANSRSDLGSPPPCGQTGGSPNTDTYRTILIRPEQVPANTHRLGRWRLSGILDFGFVQWQFVFHSGFLTA